MMVTDFVSHGTPSASCWAPLCKWQMELPILWAWIVIPMMITTANMAICLHPNVTDSQMMTAVKGANLVAETFCCLHCNNTHQMWNETTPCVALPNGVLSTHAVAHNSNDEVAPHKFCIVTFANFKDPQKPHAKFSGMWATCHENEFWCKITLLHPSSGHSCLAGGHSRNLKQFCKMHPETMEIVSVANISTLGIGSTDPIMMKPCQHSI